MTPPFVDSPEAAVAPCLLAQRAMTTLVLAGLLGGAAVVLGAFGAHALAPRFTAQNQQTWQVAVHYHALHAVVLLGIACLQLNLPAAWPQTALAWASGGFAAGIGLFSGSLYLLALGGPRWLGPITPLGGLCFVFGWFCLAGVGALQKLAGR